MNRIINWWQFLSEPGNSEDFGKPWDEWKASKAAKGSWARFAHGCRA